MTKNEKFLAMAFTGVHFMPFRIFHSMAEKELGRTIERHEYAHKTTIEKMYRGGKCVWPELRDKVRTRFLIMIER